MSELSIGSVRLKNRLLCAPMVDVTDLAYRLLCKKAGAAITYTEMTHIEALLHENEKTQKSVKMLKRELPVGIQITGKSVKEFEAIAKKPLLEQFSIVDINCGCPSLRITGSSAGSYLLNNPAKIGDMISVLKDAGHSVTAKIRLGFTKNNVLRVAKSVEKAGADALTIHARLANQGGSINPRWEEIARVKKHIGIPVIGNGNVFAGKDAATMLEIADGAMVARAAIGNPLVFREMLRYLRTGKEKEISAQERIEQLRNYLVLARKHDVVDLGRVKYLAGQCLKGFVGAANARSKAVQATDPQELERFLATIEV